MAIMKHMDVMLHPDPSRTVIRPFSPDYPDAFKDAGTTRSRQVIDRVLGFSDAEVETNSAPVRASLDGRHGDINALLDRRFDDVCAMIDHPGPLDQARRRLIGAFFSQEYAFEAAALFNPSAVRHPDQHGVPQGSIRFVMSLRGIGEGHVSSVTFRTGTWTPGGAIEMDPASPVAVSPIIGMNGGDNGGTHVELHCGGGRTVSETVLFPITPSQKQGIEDVRLTQFREDDGSETYYGTYTAFNGMEARSELLSGSDFRSFEMRPMAGSAAAQKGMALFPRRIAGRYAMLARQDNENIWLVYSDDLCTWEGGEKLLSPAEPWESIQIGNCGPPIEIDEGWLVLTHGVGAMRTYCIGACLLDKHDPSKLLARTREPILAPSDAERHGYVPNVVYSCGGIVHDRMLLLPYAIADTFTSFATATVDEVLAMMTWSAAKPGAPDVTGTGPGTNLSMQDGATTMETNALRAGGRTVYRHRIPTRLWHWSNALSISVMLMSGLMIFNAHPQLYWGRYGADQDHSWLEITAGHLRIGPVTLPTFGIIGTSPGGDFRAFPGWITIPNQYDLAGAREWHLAFAWLLVVPAIAYLIWGFVRRHVQRDLAPTLGELSPANIWHDIKQHARLRFPTGEAASHYNILQKLAYNGVIFLAMPGLIFTGFAMSPGMDAAWPWLLELFGGRQSARSIHFICMTAIAVFIVVHLLMVVLAGPINEVRSMVTGRYKLPAERKGERAESGAPAEQAA